MKNKKGKKDMRKISFSKKINHLKTLPYLTFVACVEFEKLKADKKTAEDFEVMSVKTLKQAANKLVKKGLFNVNDEIYTISKNGLKHLIVKK